MAAEDGVMELVLENGMIAMRGRNSSYSFRSGRDNIIDAKGQSSSCLWNLDSFMSTDYPGSILPLSDFDFDMICGNNINSDHKNNRLAETHVVPEYYEERNNNWAAATNNINGSRFVPEILPYPKPTGNCGNNCSRNGADYFQDHAMDHQPITTTQPDDEQSEAVVPKATSFKNRTGPYDQDQDQDQDQYGPKSANLPRNLVQRSVPTTSLCSHEASNDPSSFLRNRYEDSNSSDGLKNSNDIRNDEREFTLKSRPLKRARSKDKREKSSNRHSLYEKRRNKINKKMRALQELIPNSNKIKADKATTLDQAIEYLKTLQLQVQMMSSMGPRLCMPPFMLRSPALEQAPLRFDVFSPMGFGMGMGGGVGGRGGQSYPLPTAMFGQMFPMPFLAMNRGQGPFLGSVPFLNSTSSSDAVLHSIYSQMLQNKQLKMKESSKC